MRTEIAQLNAIATELGCVVFPAAKDIDNVIIVFAGAGGVYFNALSLISGIECGVIYFQDCFSAWYQGSVILPPVYDIASTFLREQIGARRAIFFGQSSGAYACLVAARFFQNSITSAVAPQTFADPVAKSRLHLIGDIEMYTTLDGLVDIVDHWSCGDHAAFVAVIFSASEHNNPIHHHYWIDHLHVMRLIDLAAFQFYLVAESHHNILQSRAREFSALIDGARVVASDRMHEFLVHHLTQIFNTRPAAEGEITVDDRSDSPATL